MMNMNKEQVEKTVHESKCDELSAMFNMMMDNKRKDKGRSSIINHRMQKPHVKGSFWKITSYLAFKLWHWSLFPHLTLKHFFLFKKWCFQCYDNDVIGYVIMLYWKLHTGIYEKVKRLAMANWYRPLFKMLQVFDKWYFWWFCKTTLQGYLTWTTQASMKREERKENLKVPSIKRKLYKISKICQKAWFLKRLTWKRSKVT